MSEIGTDLESLDIVLGDLEGSIASTQNVTAAFQAELAGVNSAMALSTQQMSSFSRSISGSLRTAFDSLIFDGARLTDVLRNLTLSIADSALDMVMKPVTDHFGGLIAKGIGSLIGGVLPFENGAAFSAGRVTPFATGGVVSGPTNFPMRGGIGLMGEAGPEAIMPLARGADGRLGVRGGGGNPVTVHMNITTPDVGGFQRSKTQVAASIQRAIQRGGRNL